MTESDSASGNSAVPDTYICRPRKLIIASVVGCAILVFTALLGWFALPIRLRDQFELSQVVTLLILLGLLIIGVVIIASSHVHAGPDGVRIRNGLGVHRLPWSRVHKFLLRPGDPWGIVLIKPDDRPFEVDLDAERFQLMGIQSGDGPRALAEIETLRAMHRRYADGPAMPDQGAPRRDGGPREAD